jgi:hypothetical protein
VTSSAPGEPPERAILSVARPLTIGQVFEATIGLLSRYRRMALAIALLFVAPGAIVTAVFGMRANEVASGMLPELGGEVLAGNVLLTEADAARLLGAVVTYLGATVLAGILASVGAVAYSALVISDVRGAPADLSEALGTALRRTLSVVAFAIVTSVVVVGLIVAAIAAVLVVLAVLPGDPVSGGGPGVFAALVVGVALVVAVVTLSMRWAPAFAIMAFEDAGWRAALARAWQISRDQVLRILVVVAVGTLMSLLLSLLVAQLLAIVVVDWAVPTLGLDVTVAESLVVAAGAVIVAPLIPLLVAVLTVDLMRRHGEAPAGLETTTGGPSGKPEGS